MLDYGETEIVARIEERVAKVTGVPADHVEKLNMVRYRPGEFFKVHHDGVHRPATLFLYLNDVPESEGGETEFPYLGIRVRPKKGSAVVWKNITEDGQMDERLIHQGLPPKSGIKYGVNCFVNEAPLRCYERAHRAQAMMENKSGNGKIP